MRTSATYAANETMGCPRCHGSGEVPLSQSAVNVLRLIRGFVAPITGAEVESRLGMTHQNADGRLVLLERAGHVVRGLRGPDGYEWTAFERTLPTADDVLGIFADTAEPRT